MSGLLFFAPNIRDKEIYILYQIMRATTLPHMSLSRRRRPIKKMRKGHFFSQVKFDDDDFDD